MMRRALSVATAVLALAATGAASQADAQTIAGNWLFDVNLDAGSGQATFTFQVEGNAITGTYGGVLGEYELTGTIEGNVVKFGFESPDAGRIYFDGVFNGETIEGTCDYGAVGSGSFRGTHVRSISRSRLLGVFVSWMLGSPSGAAAQLPSDFEAVELARSHACVEVLGRVDALDSRLAPLAERSQRLLAIGQAIALEERAVIDSLRVSDTLEADVRAWFVADAELAQRYLAAPSPAVQEERSAARETIQQRVVRELETLQARADSMIAATGTLASESGRCTGAVFVRAAVLEECASVTSAVCDAARDSTSQPRQYRFVESAEVLWGLQELRAWSAPGPIQVLANGQLGGARTVGLTRTANIVVTLVFGPQVRRRVDLTAAETERLVAIADSLGFGAEHPEVMIVPSLAVQATLPDALGGESRYMLHFGLPESADVLWVAAAGTGVALEGVIELGPARLARLLGGEQLFLTALRPTETGTNEAVYTIELTFINQGPATTALAQYMAQRLASDLAQLLTPTTPAPADSTTTPR